MASSDDLTIVLPTQDDPEDETMELITSEGIPQTINSGEVTHTSTTLVGTQNIFIGQTGTVGEATLDLRIDDAKEIFVETESFRNVERKLKDFGHVTICGASGEGKTTAALVLGSQYRQKGYKLAFVDRIEQFDLDSFLSSSPRVFLIIDDMFGTVGLSTDVSQLTTILNTLYQHLQHCKRASEKRKQQPKKEGKDESKTSGVSDPKAHPTKDIRVIFTSKTYNFHAGLAQLQYERFALFKSQTVMDLTTQKQHRYTQAEKKAIYEHHRNRHRESSDEDCEDLPDYEDLDTDSNSFGIPLTCKLFFFEFSSFTRNAKKFFKEPLFYLTLELRKLLKSNTDRSAILILMLLCEDKLDLAKLQAEGKDQKLDIMVRTVSELWPKASRLGMHEAATTFRGTYFTRGDVVGFAHSSISDACACSLFDISPTFVLTHCSDNFIYERVQPQPEQETNIDDHLHLIYVSEAYYDILTTRFAESIKNGQFSKSVTHPILRQDQVALQLLEKLQHDGSMDEYWVHESEKEHCFLFWAVLGHNNNFVFEIENITREEFTQTEISEAMLGCVFKNNLTALKWLFSRSESPDIGINSLLLSAAATGSSEILVYLIENGANVLSTDADKKTIIHLACMAGHAKTLTVLKEHDIKHFNDELKDKVMNSTDNEGWTPLMVAALTGSNDCYQVLQSISNKKTKDYNGDDIVHLACKGGNEAIVKHLVSPSNVNTRGQYGWTPVMMAAVKGHQSVFDLLVSKDADLTLVDKDGNGLLHVACYGGNTAIVKYLVSPSNVNTRGQNGWTPVMMAASKGHQSVFDLLVSKNADRTLVDKDGNGLLHVACYGCNTAIVQYLVSPSNINTRGQYGWTPVMMAVGKGNQSVFDLLVSETADLTLVDNNGDSLFHLACYGGNTDIVQHLVSQSNVNTIGQNGWTPVMMAAMKGHQSLFDLLVSKDADRTLVDKDGNRLLHNACNGGNTAIVQYLVSPSNVNTRGQYGRTPVMMAAFKGHQSVVDLLVSKNADLTLVDKDGNGLFHVACYGGNTAIVQYLVSPSNINTRGQYGWTPVMMAASKGHQSVFDLLVSKDADLTLVDKNGNSLLHVACYGGNTIIVQHLVSPSNVNTRGENGWTPVMMAAFKGHQSAFYLLVSKDADLTLVENNGDSLLHNACLGGNTAIVQYLVSPSNVNTTGQNGLTPVMMAAFKGHQSVFDLLVSKHADLTVVDNNGDSLLHNACFGGNTAIVQYLVSPSNVNTRGQYGWTPVMMAAVKGHQSVFDLLVSKNADRTLVDKNGNSLLHLACFGGNTAIVQYLVSPSNVNTRGQNGWTPVMMAVMKGHQSVFDLLVSKHADLTLVENNGDSLLHFACVGGDTAIVQYLVSPSNVNTRGQNGWTPVMMAASKGHKSVFDLLVSKHADLTLVDYNGDSLLHFACVGGDTAIVQYLVSP